MKIFFCFFFFIFFGCSNTISPNDGSENSSSSEFQYSSSSFDSINSSSSIENNLTMIFNAVSESGIYTTKDSVAAYLCKFEKLPSNYVNKTEAKNLYELKTGNTFSKWNFNPWLLLNVMIGGDDFQNTEQLLPTNNYKESDVNYTAENRGTNRLVYASGCIIYFTKDHYSSFEKINFD